MSTIRRILVPIDFSETSAEALRIARVLADACGASLHLLHVIGYSLTDARTPDQQRQDAIGRLDAWLDRDDRPRRQATTSCEFGTPAMTIVDHATEHAIDLIVMGTHWHGPTAQMVTGSIADAVVGLAPCSVLAVKGARVNAPAAMTAPVP